MAERMLVEVQTQNSEGERRTWPSLREAIQYAERGDITVWKVSYRLPNGEVIPLVYSPAGWLYSPIDPKDLMQQLQRNQDPEFP
jgi:hypothetical protein